DRQGFRYDELLARVRAQRRGLVRAALTILRGYDAAGRPRHGQARMGSFEQWDDLVRGAVVWAGLADPAAASDPNVGRGRIRAESDEDLDVLGALLAALRDAYGTATFATADVASQAANDPPLRAALEAAGAVDKGGKVTARALGYRFRAAQDRIVGGRKLVTERADRHANKRLWRVVGGDGGNGGDHPSHGDRHQGAQEVGSPENPICREPETSPPSP